MDNSNYYDIDPSPCILYWTSFILSQISVLDGDSIKVYKRNIWNVTMSHVRRYL